MEKAARTTRLVDVAPARASGERGGAEPASPGGVFA